jgi:hypothetical protein
MRISFWVGWEITEETPDSNRQICTSINSNGKVNSIFNLHATQAYRESGDEEARILDVNTS